MNSLVIRKQELEAIKKDNIEIEVFSDGIYWNTSSGDIIIERYLETLNSKNTVRSYKKSIYDFFNFLYGDVELTVRMLIVNPSHAMGYMSVMKSKLDKGEIKSATFNSSIKGVKHFYKWLMGQTTLNDKDVKLFNINPFEPIKQVSENDSEGSEPLTARELLLMLENPSTTDEHLARRNALLIELAISTGIRNTALLSITRDDIKKVGDDWVLKAVDKNNKIANKKINNYAQDLLNWYDEDLKIRTRDNKTIFNLHPSSANRLVVEWADKVGLQKKITFHSLRTTTAVQVYHMYGDNINKAQMVLNHSNAGTTRRYIVKENLIDGDAENIVENMKGILNDYEKSINEMTKEQLVELMMSLEDGVKIQLMNGIRKLNK